ncbi:MAG TPA: DUF3037 domain-containing protein [Flavihumibacter sp.]|nr:DUF3037 domain-containing protein [Flavihumibacter sp.]
MFEYAIIRFVPRVEREEFINIGVIVFCKRPAFLQARLEVDMNKLLALDPSIDIETLQSHLQSFEKVCMGHAGGGPIGAMDHASRFRWLTATRSTIVQTSKVHIGFSEDLQKTVNDLFQKMVL